MQTGTKEETKFTRGPWSWEYDQDSGRPIALSNGPTDVLLATGDESSAWAEVTEADADLIAAAPEMLAALNMILYAHEKTNRNGVCPHVPAALEAARAAVNKALNRE